MANSDAARGLIPRYNGNGSPYTGQCNKYFIASGDATAVFIGDAVKSAGSADTRGIPTVIQAAAGDTIRGVVVAFDLDPTNLENKHRLASTTRYVYVCAAPDVIFEIQDDSVGGDLAAVDIGLNADLVVAAGSTVTGYSGMELDTSTKATTAAQLRIVGLADKPDNEIGTNSKVLVIINEHEFKTTTGV